MFHSYNPWKRQKTNGFVTFSRGIEMEHWSKLAKQNEKYVNKTFLRIRALD